MGVDNSCLTSSRNTSSSCATRNAGGVWMSSIDLSCTSRSTTKQSPFESKRSSSPSSSSPPPPPAISASKCYMFPPRFVSRATTTTICSDVRSSSFICVSGGRWSTASVYGASSTAPAVAGAQDAEVLGTAAWTVSCPTGQQDIARSVGATRSCMPASSFQQY